jgi:hypothetical protein
MLGHRPELAVVAAEAPQVRHQGIMAGNVRHDPPERVQQPVPLPGHGHGEHFADFRVTEKKVRVKEKRHLISICRYPRETLFQALFIHGVILPLTYAWQIVRE